MWPPFGKIAAHSAYEMFSRYQYLSDMVKSHSDRPKQSGIAVSKRPLLIYCRFKVIFNEKYI